MSDWDAIRRNSLKSGHFAGMTTRDEDAYYAFFADNALNRTRLVLSGYARFFITLVTLIKGSSRASMTAPEQSTSLS